MAIRKNLLGRPSREPREIQWQHPAEVHVVDKEIQKEYWDWRKKGMDTHEPIRYPVTFDEEQRASCLGALWNPHPGADQALPWQEASLSSCLGYVEARKRIYVPLYENAVRGKPQFAELVDRLTSGENLLIVEVDGPHQGTWTSFSTTPSTRTVTDIAWQGVSFAQQNHDVPIVPSAAGQELT